MRYLLLLLIVIVPCKAQSHVNTCKEVFEEYRLHNPISIDKEKIVAWDERYFPVGNHGLDIFDAYTDKLESEPLLYNDMDFLVEVLNSAMFLYNGDNPVIKQLILKILNENEEVLFYHSSITGVSPIASTIINGGLGVEAVELVLRDVEMSINRYRDLILLSMCSRQ